MASRQWQEPDSSGDAREEGECSIPLSRLPDAAAAAAVSYHCSDFDWEAYKHEVENSFLLQQSNAAKETTTSENDVWDGSAAWEAFHRQHCKATFYKERRYLLSEFPELCCNAKSSPLTILELGCGSGSSIIPILRKNPLARVYGCDCSSTAVRLAHVQATAAVGVEQVVKRLRLFVGDATRDSLVMTLKAAASASLGTDLCMGIHMNSTDNVVGRTRVTADDGNDVGDKEASAVLLPECCGEVVSSTCCDSLWKERGSATGISTTGASGDVHVDIALLVFTLSAIPREFMPRVIAQLFMVLAPGGLVMFRDYGLYDMTMLRFPESQRLEDRLYRRGEGTLVYYFSKAVLSSLFTNAGFIEEENEYCCVRLLNRRKQLHMARVWIHGKFRKPG